MATFDARAAAEEIEAEYPPFDFEGMDGETYYLPHPMMLTTGEQQAVMELQEEGDGASAELALFDLLERTAPEAMGAIKEMPAIVTAKLMEAWYEAVDEEGKSPSPSSAPNRAARRSQQTSRSKAKTSTRSRSTKSKAASKR